MTELLKMAFRKLAKVLRDPLYILWATLFNRRARVVWSVVASKEYSDPVFEKKGIVIYQGDVNFANKVRDWIPEDLLRQEREKMLASDDPLDFVLDLGQKLSEKAKIELIKWAVDPSRVYKAAHYLGFMPRLATIYVLYNIPKPGAPRGSMKWHRDTMVHKGVNVFMAITPVDELSGMYSAVGLDVIPESRVIEQPKSQIDLSRPAWDRYRVDDNTMANYASETDMLQLKGPSGTTAMVASGDVYHKGGYCIEKERIMLEVSYQSDCSQGGCSGVIDYWGLAETGELAELIKDPAKRHLLKTPEKSWHYQLLGKVFWKVSRVGRRPI